MAATALALAMSPLTAFAAHAPVDAAFVGELALLVAGGCGAVSFAEDGVIAAGEDLMSAAERGLAADVLVLVLSPASNLLKWPRDIWEPLLFDRAVEYGTRVAVVLLEKCEFPALLRRKLPFFDASADRLGATRGLKRWMRGPQTHTDSGMRFSSDLDALYAALADKPGVCTAPGWIAERFAEEAAGDFEMVLWIPAHGRTLAQIAGELGARLGMTLRDQIEQNCLRIRDTLCGRRCLVILNAPQMPVTALLPDGRTSVLITADPVRITDTAPSLSAARSLAAAGRYAEAYESLYRLMNDGIEREACARELVWICEYWDRLEEANELRFLQTGPLVAEQLRLF